MSSNMDGRMGKCKACVKSRVRENRRNRKQQYAEYERSRANLPPTGSRHVESTTKNTRNKYPSTRKLGQLIIASMLPVQAKGCAVGCLASRASPSRESLSAYLGRTSIGARLFSMLSRSLMTEALILDPKW